MCITYSREAWIEGPTGGRGRDSTRNESGLERDEYDVTTRDSIPLSVYMQGGGNRGTSRNFLRVWCLCCGCEKIMRCGGRGCVTA